MSKKIQGIFWLIICIVLALLIGVCVYNLVLAKTQKISHPVVNFEIENYGNIKMELYPEYAPNTVSNIIKLVQNGYYKDKIVYGKDEVCLYVGRNSEGEAENPKVSLLDSTIEADSDNDYEYTIEGEFVANGFEQNTLRHEKGVLSLIRSDYTKQFPNLRKESYNSGNAQIGIMMNNSRELNGMYAGFGRVIEGLDILEKIYTENEIEKETDENGEIVESSSIEKFKDNIVISNATVDTFGQDYGMPKVEKAFDYQSYLYDMLSKYYSNQNN